MSLDTAIIWGCAAVLAVWIVVSCVVSIVIGRSIRLAERERATSSTAGEWGVRDAARRLQIDHDIA